MVILYYYYTIMYDMVENEKVSIVKTRVRCEAR